MTLSSRNPLITLIVAFSAASLPTAHAQDKKATYDEDVVPILRNNCLKCHNPDKLKGDLDLSTYNGALKGGGSGVVLNSGDPTGSKLFKAITHVEDPTMPPNSGKLADKDVDVIKRWITGGLLETSGSKAIASKAPKIDMTLKAVTQGKPDGPPPMPEGLGLETNPRTERTSAMTGLAASPWAPLFALGSQHQVLLYHSRSFELLGVLPYPEGYPNDLKFSRNGKLLLAGGGHASQSGQVIVWDVTTGQRLMTVGDEYDSVLAADMSADQSRVALGGPDKLLKIFTTKDGAVQNKIKKHTDWVTTLEFSPDSEFLASGDRNGGLITWEAGTGHEVAMLAGHKAGITAVTWRPDSAFLASASEDGTIKIWQKDEPRPANSWNAHNGGVLSVQYSREGQLISCGRDNKITLWSAEGRPLRSMQYSGELPIRARFSDDSKRIIATDWAGSVLVFDASTGKRAGELDSNPSPLAERIALAEKHVEDLQAAIDKVDTAITAAESALMTAESEGTNAKAVESAREKLRLAREDKTKAADQLESAGNALAKLKAAPIATKTTPRAF